MTERQIHDGFTAYLRKNKLCYCHHRMDRKSGIGEGWPDFTVVHCNRALLIEVKTPKGKLSKIQEEVIAHLRSNGTSVVVARSVAECVQAVEAWCGVEKPSGEALGPYEQHDWPGLKEKVRTAGMKPPKEPKAKKQSDLPASGNGAVPSGADLYLVSWKGESWVAQRKSTPPDVLLHRADQHDLLTLKASL